MSFGPEKCWDCPIALHSLVPWLLVGLCLVSFVTLARGLPSRVGEVISGVLLVLTAGFFIVATLLLWRDGIDWQWRRLSTATHFVPGLTQVALLVWYGACLAWSFLLRRLFVSKLAKRP
jgi:hypothetical protein